MNFWQVLSLTFIDKTIFLCVWLPLLCLVAISGGLYLMAQRERKIDHDEESERALQDVYES